MRPIDADALMAYCNNQKIRTVDANDIARFPTVYGWISVKDRLPESGTVCLTYSPKGRMRVAKAFLPSTLPGTSYDPMECWWYLSGCGGRFVAVTHWMPLPDPPKECEA